MRFRLPIVGAICWFALLFLPAGAGAYPAYVGVNVHSLWDDHSRRDNDRELDLARSVGVNVVRVDVSWGSLQINGPNTLERRYVARLDHLMDAASRRGIKVLATLVGTPCWASTAPPHLKRGCRGAWWLRDVSYYPPANAAHYARVARWLTARHGSRMAALEIWNEPNGPAFFKGPNKAAAYARLLRAAYPAAKAGNPSVPVLGGALERSDRPFLDALYAHGIKGFADGISFHPYTERNDPRAPLDPNYRDWSFVPGIQWMREGQLAAGDRTPLWITEFGWTTGTGTSWRVTEAQQAEYTAVAFDLLRPLTYVRAAVLYNLRNDGSDPADRLHNYGIVRRDFRPKPAFWALRSRLVG